MLRVLVVLDEAQGRRRSANGECSWAELHSSQCFVSHSSSDYDGIASEWFTRPQSSDVAFYNRLLFRVTKTEMLNCHALAN